MYDIVNAYWNFLNHFSSYLLLGFCIAGILHGIVNDKFIQKNLLGNSFTNIIKASLIGIPLPLCSCGVIPVAISLYKKGASKASTASFLISTPQTGVDSIMMTYGMFLPILPLFIIIRPVAALIAGLFGGTLIKFFDDEEVTDLEESIHEKKTLKDMLEYGFITLPQDIAKPLLIGILLASLIAIRPPDELFRMLVSYGGIGELIIVLILSIPLYVCATASIPLAVSLVGTGTISIGGALIFLMAGPVTNLATISTIYNILGKKFTALYLISVTCVAFLFGYGINHYYPTLNNTINWHHLMHSGAHEHTGLFTYLCSIAILLILLNALLKPFEKKVEGSDLDTTINVSGMTCNHCKQSVTNAILGCENVADVKVDLNSGNVFISGKKIKLDEIYSAVEKSGFKIIK